ncbi:MAG: hypothetical protein QOD75_3490 [Blastocatellia bacterium]|jgi:hypothetical protein|nr:hypothetical protein [Blastocatellia bacterium]
MPNQLSLPQIILWLFVIVLGIEIGAGMYEMLVVVPVWSAAPPDSVLGYFHHNVANAQFALNAGGRFWLFFTPLTGLLAIATFLSGLRTAPEHRKCRMIGAGLAIVVVAATFAWFVPNIITLLGEGVTKLSGAEITRITNWWVRLNWVRAAAYIAGWLSALRALTIPSAREVSTTTGNRTREVIDA